MLMNYIKTENMSFYATLPVKQRSQRQRQEQTTCFSYLNNRTNTSNLLLIIAAKRNENIIMLTKILMYLSRALPCVATNNNV